MTLISRHSLLSPLITTSLQAITYWVFKEVMILRSHRHQTEEEVEGYRLHSRLTILTVNAGDYGAYKCVSKNSLGETEGQIRLYGEGCEISR